MAKTGTGGGREREANGSFSRRWLGLRLVWQSINHFAGLGVVELLARFALNGIRVRIQMIDVLAHLRIFLLQILDLLLQRAVFCAFLLPY